MARIRTAITPQFYEALLAAYRAMPGNAAQAGIRAGCDWRTARKGWEKGWVKEGKPWALPIEFALEEERRQLRAARLQAAEQAAADEEKTAIAARKDAVATLTEEARMVQIARANTIGVMAAIINPLILASKVLVKQVTSAIDDEKLTPNQRIALLYRISQMTKQAADASRLVLETERLRLGQPTQVLGLKIADLTPEQAAEELEHLARGVLETAGDTHKAETKH